MYYEYNHKDGVVGVVPPIDRNSAFFSEKNCFSAHPSGSYTRMCNIGLPPFCDGGDVVGGRSEHPKRSVSHSAGLHNFIYNVNR